MLVCSALAAAACDPVSSAGSDAADAPPSVDGGDASFDAECLLRSDLEEIAALIPSNEPESISGLVAEHGDVYYLHTDLIAARLIVRREDGARETLWRGSFDESGGENADTEFTVIEDAILVSEGWGSDAEPNEVSGLFSLPKDSGAPVKLSEESWPLRTALVHEGKLYYGSDDFTVVDLATGAASTLTSSAPSNFRYRRRKPLKVGEWLYDGQWRYTSGPNAPLQRAPFSAGALETLRVDLGTDDDGVQLAPLDVESDGALLVAAVGPGTRLYHVPPEGGSATLFAELGGGPSDDIDYLRCDDESLLHAPGSDTVYSRKHGADQLQPLLCLRDSEDFHVTTDDRWLYLYTSAWAGRLPLEALR